MATAKGGRPRDPVRQYFQKIDDTNKARCVDCKMDVSDKPKRLRAHRMHCPMAKPVAADCQTAAPTESSPMKTGASVKTGTLVGSPATSSAPDPEDNLPKPKRMIQPHISGFLTKTDEKTSDALDLQIAKLFYDCDIPYHVAEDRYFLTMISALRPDYSPPSAAALSGPLLRRVLSQDGTSSSSQLDDGTDPEGHPGSTSAENPKAF